eukprot:7251226-Alexandrium_andersonii.AAC.1
MPLRELGSSRRNRRRRNRCRPLDLLPASEAIGTVHGDGADHVLAQVLSHLRAHVESQEGCYAESRERERERDRELLHTDPHASAE